MKAFQLHFEEKRRCPSCGREFYCQQSFDFSTRRYTGDFVYCPHCDNPFEHTLLESDLTERAKEMMAELETRKNGEKLTEGLSVKKAKGILRFLL